MAVDDDVPGRGCRGGLHDDELHRLDQHGTLQHAEMVRRNTGWYLILTDRNVLGASTA